MNKTNTTSSNFIKKLVRNVIQFLNQGSCPIVKVYIHIPCNQDSGYICGIKAKFCNAGFARPEETSV